MGLDPDFMARMADPMARALRDMTALENGSIANPDENRRVGHYWLRAPWLAPTAVLTRAIEAAASQVAEVAAAVHAGDIGPPGGGRFSELVVIGIGGSALGPQLLAGALSDSSTSLMRPHFLDNTDPEGMDRVLAGLADRLDRSLFLVISKSGGTAETRNAMRVAQAAVAAQGLNFTAQAMAITGEASTLDRMALQQGWLARLPMWDWVGGRTSVTSAVGLLPAALLGIDTSGLLAGAAACDEATRNEDVGCNPAALLALAWFRATDGRGARDMVLLPYCDRLMLFSRYLQQLVMESLGKAEDRQGNAVAQGIAVYGNKGSTDQHAYVQQLRDGLDNFFVTFIEVLEDGPGPAARLEVAEGVTSGDYLRGFLLGTRRALDERGRLSITLTVPRVDAWTLGVLIALYERAVGLYASLIDVNAYHQPGVEAGKKAAGVVLTLQHAVIAHLATGQGGTAEEIAQALGEADIETVFHLLEGLAANGRAGREDDDESSYDARYTAAK
jgi:glucose-6-phosphate isomerase